jgi:transposase
MEHVAIDLGGRQSQICVRGADGTIVEERRCATDELGSYLSRRPASCVVLEMCAEAFHVTDLAKAAGHQVRVVPAMWHGRWALGHAESKTTARMRSWSSTRIELPSVHVPSLASRELRAQSTSREALIRTHTLLVNSTRGWMRTRGLRIRSGSVETLPARTRAAAPLPAHIETILVVIETLNQQIAHADRELKKVAKEHSACRVMMTMPGVGPVTAVRLTAAIDEVSRFGSAAKVQAYLGLVPGEHSSSEQQRRTGITKAGPPAVRRTLLQAAWSLRLRRPREPVVRSRCGGTGATTTRVSARSRTRNNDQ